MGLKMKREFRTSSNSCSTRPCNHRSARPVLTASHITHLMAIRGCRSLGFPPTLPCPTVIPSNYAFLTSFYYSVGLDCARVSVTCHSLSTALEGHTLSFLPCAFVFFCFFHLSPDTSPGLNLKTFLIDIANQSHASRPSQVLVICD